MLGVKMLNMGQSSSPFVGKNTEVQMEGVRTAEDDGPVRLRGASLQPS